MSGFLVSLWQKLVKPPQGLEPAREADGQGTRGVGVQECTRMAGLDEAPAASNPDRFEATVEQISQSQIYLLVGRPINKGSLLSVELPGSAQKKSDSVLAYVLRSWPRDGNWALT